MNIAHVIDAATGTVLDGTPAPELWMATSRFSAPVLARYSEGVWQLVDDSPRNLAFFARNGWETRRVRVLTERDIVFGAIEWACGLMSGRSARRYRGAAREQLEACR